MNNKKVINAWAMYDWANSVYSLVITSTIFPIYYNAVTKSPTGNTVNFFGMQITNTVLYAWSISFSFLLISFLSPILSGIADYRGNKKRFMQFFAWMGSLCCMGMFFFKRGNLELGILLAVGASLGYAGSLVFYNAFLPEICSPDRYDKVSAKGYALGYIGSVILMIVNLMMVMKPEWFGITGPNAAGLASRISFLTVGLWWIGFSQYTFYFLPQTQVSRPDERKLISHGYQELLKVWKSFKELPDTRRFLIAFFFYNMGVQTVMYLAASFGDKELHLESSVLISSILTIQLVAIGGAYLFAEVSKRKGNLYSLSIMIVIWIGICISAYFVKGPMPFRALAFVVGLVMGGIQSLSRSTYSKLLPETKDHASYFSFYDVTEKLSIVLGTALFGLTESLTGSMRNSVWPLAVAFIAGLFLLRTARSPKLQAA
jgi:UMF1 family MFS transporter